jgi:hypothetical protein
MTAHFVTFYSPGTFMAEDTTKPIDSWDVSKAMEMAKSITERHGAIPYGFVFTTRKRRDTDLDSKVTKRSGTYYLPHCKVETIADLKAKADSEDSILISNMECNGWDRVVTTTKGWRWTQPLREGDVVLDKNGEAAR